MGSKEKTTLHTRLSSSGFPAQLFIHCLLPIPLCPWIDHAHHNHHPAARLVHGGRHVR